MKKILIADDDDHIRELVATTIGSEQYDLYKACDGKDALEKAIENVPDLMLLDVGMPRMNGFEVCRQLKNNPETAHIYIIMLTSYTQEDYVNKAFDAGANEYFVKPFSPMNLLNKIVEILG